MKTLVIFFVLQFASGLLAFSVNEQIKKCEEEESIARQVSESPVSASTEASIGQSVEWNEKARKAIRQRNWDEYFNAKISEYLTFSGRLEIIKIMACDAEARARVAPLNETKTKEELWELGTCYYRTCSFRAWDYLDKENHFNVWKMAKKLEEIARPEKAMFLVNSALQCYEFAEIKGEMDETKHCGEAANFIYCFYTKVFPWTRPGAYESHFRKGKTYHDVMKI